MDMRIPFDVQAFLDGYIKLLVSEIGEILHGVYIYGSLALGSFDSESSDIDFVTVVNRKLSEKEIAALDSIHKRLKNESPYGIKLEGEYVDKGSIDVGNPDKKHPYFAFGRYEGLVSLKSIAWYQLQQSGIAIIGENFKNITNKVEWNAVRNEFGDRLNNYWPKISAKWWLLMFERWVALVVLNLCRIYFALGNMEIVSKCKGGEYALEKLPKEWHLLIREALRIQSNLSDKSLFDSRITRMKVTKSFVKYMVEICNSYFFETNLTLACDLC